MEKRARSLAILSKTTSRRGFNALLIGGAIGVGLGAGRHISTIMDSPLQQAMRKLRLVNFQSREGTIFQLSLPDQRVLSLVLESTLDLRTDRMRAPRNGAITELFALTFSGPRSQNLEQGTYLFRSRFQGQFDLFIVPQQATGDRQFYQALINRPSEIA